MIKNEYHKTVFLWTDDEADLSVLSEIILKMGLQAILCGSEKDLLQYPGFLIFAKESNIYSLFFEYNPQITKKINENELQLIVIDEFIGYHIPKHIKKIKIKSLDDSEIFTIIDLAAKNAMLINKKYEIFKTKLNRIFYIYTQLTEKGEVTFNDVLDKTKISKRTFSRDIKTIKDVCQDKSIEFDTYINGYMWREWKKK